MKPSDEFLAKLINHIPDDWQLYDYEGPLLSSRPDAVSYKLDIWGRRNVLVEVDESDMEWFEYLLKLWVYDPLIQEPHESPLFDEALAKALKPQPVNVELEFCP